MPIHFCQNCNQRFTVGFDTCDFEHICNRGNDVVDEEDVVVIGDWEDYSGSGTRAPQEVMRAGLTNELQGTRAGIMGKDKEADTRRGVRASTHRTRQHLQFINLENRYG